MLAELCDELQLETMQLPRVCKHADATSVDIPVVDAIHIISIECASLDLALVAAWLHRELILPGRAMEDTPKPALPQESLFWASADLRVRVSRGHSTLGRSDHE